MKRVLILSLALMAIFISCKKDPSTTNNTIVEGGPKLTSSPVTGSVAGIVVDENDNPVSGAQVMISGSLTNTDNKGFYRRVSVTLDKYISTVKVSAPGYFTAYRSFCASATTNYVNIKLISKTLAGSFSPGSGGQISLSNGSNISFPANGVNIKSSGVAYTGTVNVYAAYVDPTADDFPLTMPGSNMAEDSTKFYVLHPAGIMNVELESPSGEALQLAPNRPAHMQLTIPSSLLNKVPATIDTWSLDDRGIWMKEGIATKNGNVYDMDVSHFTFWTGGLPATAVFLTVNVKDQNANPQQDAVVCLDSYVYGTAPGITDALGNVSGMVPKDEILGMRVFVNILGCYNDPAFTQDVGPYTTTSLENFVMPVTTSPVLDISGTAIDCSGSPVVDGTAHFYIGYQIRDVLVSNGNFSLSLPVCDPVSSLDVIVIDNMTAQQSLTVTVPVTGNTVTTGAINACASSTNEYVNFVLDNTNYVISSLTGIPQFQGYVNPAYTAVSASETGLTHISFSLAGSAVGTYPTYNDTISVNNLLGLTQPGATGSISLFATPGQYFEGSFDLPFQENGNNHTLTGIFRIKRD